MRSVSRPSILFSSSELSKTESSSEGYFDVYKKFTGAKLKFGEVHKIQMSRGKLVWELSAKDARYLASEQLTHLNQAYLSVYNTSQGIIHFRADQARVYLDAQSISKAELEGNVVVEAADVKIATQHGVYMGKEKMVVAPYQVVVEGPGYKVEGVGLSFDIEQQSVKLSQTVKSEFDPNARTPQELHNILK